MLASVAVVALLAAGCSSSGGEADSAVDAPAAERLDAGGAYEEAGAYDEASSGSSVVGEPQHVITEGSMTVVVDEPTEIVDRVTQIVTGAGGFVESRSEQAPTDDRAGRAWLVLRIPAAELDATLDEVEELGRLSTREFSATDVSLTVSDLDARIEALEISIDRLLAMLAEAQRTEDLISLERTLQERQGEINSLRAQRTVLGNRVALATIEVTITSDPPPVTVGPGGFWPGLVAGWNALLDTLRGASVVVGMLLPWAVFLGVIGYVVARLVRAVRRRRPARPAAPAPYPPGAHATGAPNAHQYPNPYSTPYAAPHAATAPVQQPQPHVSPQQQAQPSQQPTTPRPSADAPKKAEPKRETPPDSD